MSDRQDGLGDVAPQADVLRVLADLGLEARSFSTVGTYPKWRPGRVTYRVELASGETIKVRRLTRTRAPRRAELVVRALDDPDLPVPLALDGRVTVERWVDGVPLDTITPTVPQIEAAADLLGRLHAHTSVPGRPFRRVGSVAPLLAKSEKRIDALRERDLLSDVEARALAARLRGGLPERATRGVVHGDLCAENLVVTPDDRLVSIDNERVRFDFLDYDLARTWVRWPMPASARAAFERRYSTWGRAVPVADEAAAWRVTAAVKSSLTISGTPAAGRDLARAQLDRLFAAELG
jgi:aminoglycoside phosphotransferase (APT) family kinase protein